VEAGYRQVEPLVIRPGSGWVGVDFAELWRYRELLYFFTWRDLKVRYKQTLLGAAWAVLVPFLAMVVFTLFFSHVAHVGSQGLPYPIFSYAALVAWYLFANSLALSSQSLVAGSNLITKVYFPRALLVLSPIVASLVDFALAFVVLVGLMVYYGVYPDPAHLPAILPLILLVLVTSAGAGLGTSALMVRYRDLRYALPFLTQILMFFSSVIVVPSFSEPWRSLYALNPMVGVVEGFRWALLDSPRPSGWTFLISAISGLVLLVAGTLYFKRTEQRVADVV
jgi:homopolymeric O-antigen transport system permease protein